MITAQNGSVCTACPMRILKEKVDSIVLSAGSETMIYRKLQVLTCTDLTRLQRLALIQHPNIATLYSIEINKQINGCPIVCGVLYESTCKSLTTTLREYGNIFTEAEIINTLEPIAEAAEFMITHDYYPSIRMDNIVWSWKECVKFIDGLLIQGIKPKGTKLCQVSGEKVYQQFAKTAFELLAPDQKTKSWKKRIAVAKMTLTESGYTFFLGLVNKAKILISDRLKTKQIIKRSLRQNRRLLSSESKFSSLNRQKTSCESSEPQVINGFAFQQGKQNQVVQ